jgi:hypothetical protein
MYYTISREFISIPGLMYCTDFLRPYTANPLKMPHIADCQDWPRLCSCLFLSPRARSEATTSSSSPPLYHARASPGTQLSQEGRLYTGRGVADEHELVDHAFDTLLINEGARKQHGVEQEHTCTWCRLRTDNALGYLSELKRGRNFVVAMVRRRMSASSHNLSQMVGN